MTRIIWGTFAVVLMLGAGRASAAGPFEKAPFPEGTKNRIDFTVTVTPGDPFSESNRAGDEGKGFRPGEVVRLTITATPRKGYHTYPLIRRTPKQDADGLTTLRYDPNPELQPLWPLTESPRGTFKNQGSGLGVLLEHEAPFILSQDVLVKPTAKPGTAQLRFTIHIQVCNGSCAWGDHHFEVPIRIAAGPAKALTPDLQARLDVKPSPPKVVSVPSDLATTGGEETPDSQPPAEGGLLAFILQGIFWGAVSLVTPCVFPMIPITVSFFLKKSEKQHHRPLTLATVYTLTIVVVLTIAATALLSFFRWLSINPEMNIGLGLLFVFFALSLFGMYDIELPSGLAQYTSSREGQGGLLGTMFMALTFTIISFACVAPFLGGFGGTAAGSTLTLTDRVLGGAAFSVTFASPFFILALFPNLLKRMPRSGNWLNTIKVVMGFLEMAAALKFFRAGELVLSRTPSLFTYDLLLSLYVGICVLAGLYLLNFYRLPHDTPSEHLGVVRMLFGLTFLGLGIYLTPALFAAPGAEGGRQRPAGAIFAWVDSFLLPEEAADLPWVGSLDKGLEEARAKGKLVFIDFTGKTCTNCKLNEANVFTKKDVKDLLRRYVLVQLYTDRVPDKYYSLQELNAPDIDSRQRADAARHLAFQREQFNTEQLPLYVIVRPTGDGKFQEVAQYKEGKINNVGTFLQFLDGPLRKQVAQGQ